MFALLLKVLLSHDRDTSHGRASRLKTLSCVGK